MKAKKCAENITKCGARSFYARKAKVKNKNVNRVVRLINYAEKTWKGYPQVCIN